MTKNQESSKKRFYESKKFRINLLGFLIFLLAFYAFMFFAKGLATFNQFNFENNTHHFGSVEDDNGGNNLVHRLAVFDSNFYLQIADKGYSEDVLAELSSGDTSIEVLSYAFPPGYPSLVGALNVLFGDVYVSAFVLSFLMAIGCFVAIWWLVNKWYGDKTATKASWLIMTLPLGFFFYSYYSEALTVILLVFLLDGYRKRSVTQVGIVSGILPLVRYSTLILIPLFIAWVGYLVYKHRLKVKNTILPIVCAVVPFALWLIYLESHTGDWTVFLKVREFWGNNFGAIFLQVLYFPNQLIHFFHSSKLDILAIILSGVFLYLSRLDLPRMWWLVATSIWLFTTISTDSMSAMRYQLILIPVYIWLAFRLKSVAYEVLLSLNIVLFLVVSLLAENYWWIG